MVAVLGLDIGGANTKAALMVSGDISASANACRIAIACPGTLGAVKLALEAPSLLTAVPLITALMSSPSSIASLSRLIRIATTPLPRTMLALFCTARRYSVMTSVVLVED